MARLVWLVLQNGRSVVAVCGSATRESLTKAISDGRVLTLASASSVEKIPASAVRDFVLFDSTSELAAGSAINGTLRL